MGAITGKETNGGKWEGRDWQWGCLIRGGKELGAGEWGGGARGGGVAGGGG